MLNDYHVGMIIGSAVTLIVCRWIMAVNNDRWKAINQRAIKTLEQALAKIERLERQGPADPADWWKQN